MLLSGAWRLAQSLHESDLENRYRRRSVRGCTVVDFARNLDSCTGKRDERAVERRQSIGLTCRFLCRVGWARARRNAHHSRRAGEDEGRGAECVQLLSRHRSSTVRRGPSHAAGERDPIGQIGWLRLRRARCRIPREASGALRGQTKGRQRADHQDDATSTGPLCHRRVLPCREGKNTPVLRMNHAGGIVHARQEHSSLRRTAMQSKATLFTVICLVGCATLLAQAQERQGREGGRGGRGGRGGQEAAQPPATDKVTPEIPGVVKAGTKIEIVASGLRGSDAGVGTPDGGFIASANGGVVKFDADGKMTTLVEDSEQAAGLAMDSKGRLIGSQYTKKVSVLYPKGSEETLTSSFDGKPYIR